MRKVIHALGGLDEETVFLPQRLVAHENLVYLVIGHARTRPDDRLRKARLVAAAVLVDLHERREGQPVDMGVERADAV